MRRSFYRLRSIIIGLLFLLLVALVLVAIFQKRIAPADLVLINGDIHTLESVRPQARALVIKGNTIAAVCLKNAEAKDQVGRRTEVIDLRGGFVLPGIIDAHVHFDSAGALINDANLMTVSDEAGLRREIRRAAHLLDPGEWITEGLWGAYEQWARGDSGLGAASGAKPAWRPQRRMIDDLTPNHPCFLCRFDSQEWLANSAALREAGLETQPLEGMELDSEGKPTGIIFRPSPAFDRMRATQKPKTKARLLDENRAALKVLREAGIVEIHDIATSGQIDRFVELERRGELTCRVWLRPDLSRAAELASRGFAPGLHPQTKQPNGMLRYGALEGYIDGIMGTHGALFFEPYTDLPSDYGHWRAHTSDEPDLKTGNMDKMYSLIRAGLAAGFVPNVHAIGDRGVAEILDLYERLKRETGRDLKGFRIINAQVIRPQDFPRFKALGVIAEVNPYHIADDMRWMEEQIGQERCKGAYAFRSLLENGALLCFGSDWPGTNAALYHVHPRYLIYAAVTRQTLSGQPAGGWFPEQRLSVEEAVRAYTINNAKAAFEDHLRGSLRPGKLADITVFDRNLFKIPPQDILRAEVLYTIVDGKVVFRKECRP